MRILLLMLVLLFSENVSAQPKEYIVKQNGDTLAGEVIILPKQINVIRAPADTVILNSEDARFYVKRKTVKTVLRLVLYGYSDNIDEVQKYNYRNPVYDTTILLTPVISGEKLNLFTGKDKRKVVYFFVQRPTDIRPVQLLYAMGGDMPSKDSWGALPYRYLTYITHHRIFISQLYDMTKDCLSISEVHYRVLEYTEWDLKSFVKRYNKNCN